MTVESQIKEIPAYMRQTKSSMVKERKVDEDQSIKIMQDKSIKPPLLYQQDSEEKKEGNPEKAEKAEETFTAQDSDRVGM